MPTIPKTTRFAQHCWLVPTVLAVLAFAASAKDDEKKPVKPAETRRYGFEYNENIYPQETPQKAMKSLVKLVDTRRIDYLLSQVADPPFVDERVSEYKAFFPRAKAEAKTLLAFERLVDETTNHFSDDPLLVRELRLFAKDAEWKEEDNLATGTHKDVPARKVFMRKVGERWYLQNKQQ